MPAAHVAYHLALLQRNGQTVPKKLVLSGRWYEAETAGEDAPHGEGVSGGVVHSAGEQPTGQDGCDEGNTSSPGADPREATTPSAAGPTVALSPVVELLPGVLVNRAVDGQVWLGVPLGTDAFVQSELKRQLEEHDKRQRGIAAYATCNGDAVGHAGVRLSRQLSIAAVKYSANGRDVHFLRSLGKRAVGEAAALHDNAVDHTLAVVLGQAAQPKGDEQPMCYRTHERASASYWESLPWLRLPGIAVGVRPWARYGDAAHVGMWAQAYNSAQMSFGGVAV